MQPFNPFRKRPHQSLKMSGGAGLGYAEAVEHAPAVGEVIREAGVILLALVGVGLAAEALVRVLGAS